MDIGTVLSDGRTTLAYEWIAQAQPPAARIVARPMKPATGVSGDNP